MGLREAFTWTETYLFLKDTIKEFKDTFGKHKAEIIELQRQNQMLLHVLTVQEKTIDELKVRIGRLEHVNMDHSKSPRISRRVRKHDGTRDAGMQLEYKDQNQ